MVRYGGIDLATIFLVQVSLTPVVADSRYFMWTVAVAYSGTGGRPLFLAPSRQFPQLGSR